MALERRHHASGSATGAASSLTIESLVAANSVAHHTSAFSSDRLTVRRGQAIKLIATLDSTAASSRTLQWRASATALTGASSPHPWTCPQLPTASVAPDGQTAAWGVVIGDVQTSSATASRFAVSLCVPPDAPVGRYELVLKVRIAPGLNEPSTPNIKSAALPLTLLFNAWAADDVVYLPDENERREWVLAESGVLYTGSAYYVRMKRMQQPASRALGAC